MGDQVDDLLKSFKLTAIQVKKYDTVKSRFDDHFVICINIIFEQAKFNRRVQEEGEIVDNFITSLHALVKHCNYETLHDDMIWDWIVVGLRNAKLSERLQLDPQLMLTKAIHQVRQSEAVKKQQALMRNNFKETADKKKLMWSEPISPKNSRVNSALERERTNKEKHSSASQCNSCGKTPAHGRHNCPAKDAVCPKCSKRGTTESYADRLQK